MKDTDEDKADQSRTRQERLADALKENLRRRKEQARRRRDSGGAGSSHPKGKETRAKE